MRLVSFRIAGKQGFGFHLDGRIHRLDTQSNAPTNLAEFIEHQAAFSTLPPQADDGLPISEVELLAPAVNGAKILCVATNFHEPARAGQEDPAYPLVFIRFADSLTGHDQPLLQPAVSRMYDFEGELAVVIGKHGYRIPRDRAMKHVGGYSCLNDGSVRDWQKHSSQFTPGKNFLHSGSLGPWIVTADEVPDLNSLILQTRVNGIVKQEIGMDRMIFDVPWLIEYFSSFTPLAPGDVIATCGFQRSRSAIPP